MNDKIQKHRIIIPSLAILFWILSYLDTARFNVHVAHFSMIVFGSLIILFLAIEGWSFYKAKRYKLSIIYGVAILLCMLPYFLMIAN